ncbi:hypothetical protein CRUP_016527 [Coryphaenoides rupestris]|nr:hypothetical protein CRUP_016527 [Coryphaenoides rupestris]
MDLNSQGDIEQELDKCKSSISHLEKEVNKERFRMIYLQTLLAKERKSYDGQRWGFRKAPEASEGDPPAGPESSQALREEMTRSTQLPEGEADGVPPANTPRGGFPPPHPEPETPDIPVGVGSVAALRSNFERIKRANSQSAADGRGLSVVPGGPDKPFYVNVEYHHEKGLVKVNDRDVSERISTLGCQAMQMERKRSLPSFPGNLSFHRGRSVEAPGCGFSSESYDDLSARPGGGGGAEPDRPGAPPECQPYTSVYVGGLMADGDARVVHIRSGEGEEEDGRRLTWPRRSYSPGSCEDVVGGYTPDCSSNENLTSSEEDFSSGPSSHVSPSPTSYPPMYREKSRSPSQQSLESGSPPMPLSLKRLQQQALASEAAAARGRRPTRISASDGDSTTSSRTSHDNSIQGDLDLTLMHTVECGGVLDPVPAESASGSPDRGATQPPQPSPMVAVSPVTVQVDSREPEDCVSRLLRLLERSRRGEEEGDPGKAEEGCSSSRSMLYHTTTTITTTTTTITNTTTTTTRSSPPPLWRMNVGQKSRSSRETQSSGSLESTLSVQLALRTVELDQEKGLEMRKWVLSGILASEEAYLGHLEALLIPMKPLRAAATTSQPMLSVQQIETIFFKVPELHEIHKDFYDALLPRVQDWSHQQCVGDLFQKLDLLKHTPPCHPDHPLLQDALRISQNFLSSINEEITPRRQSMTVKKGENRQLLRDRFMVELVEGSRKLRHVFLFTDLLLCTKLKKQAAGKVQQYDCKWYIPLADLTFHTIEDSECTAAPLVQDEEVDAMKIRISQIKNDIQREKRTAKGAKVLERLRKKLSEQESLLLLTSPNMAFRVANRNGKGFTFLISSDYERAEWRELVHQQQKKCYKSFSLTSLELQMLTNSCVKLQTVHSIPVIMSREDDESSGLYGFLNVIVHSASGLKQTSNLYCTLEVDSFGYFVNKAKTRVYRDSTEPNWNEEFEIELEGSQTLRLLCYEKCCSRSKQSREEGENTDRIVAKGQIKTLQNKDWQRTVITLNGSGVFGVKINVVTKRERSKVPLIVRQCVEEIERRGMEEVGIYRVSGVATDIQALKAAFDSNNKDVSLVMREMDVNAIAGTLKLYFRELPEPLFTDDLYPNFAGGIALSDSVAKESCMLNLLLSLPEANLNESVNKMSFYNLATVFGPTLLRPSEKDSKISVGSSQPISMNDSWSLEVMSQVQLLLYFLQLENIPAPDSKRQSLLFSSEI